MVQTYLETEYAWLTSLTDGQTEKQNRAIARCNSVRRVLVKLYQFHKKSFS